MDLTQYQDLYTVYCATYELKQLISISIGNYLGWHVLLSCVGGRSEKLSSANAVMSLIIV